MSALSPVAFPPPPPTSNTLSSRERAALVRSSRKLSKILGQVPRVPEDEIPLLLSTSSGPPLTRTNTGTSSVLDAESIWRKRKPTHLPPLLTSVSGTIHVPDSPTSAAIPVYDRAARRGSVLSTAPSIVSNAPSTASGSSTSDVPSEAAQRRTKLERLRRKLGDEVPATAAFSTTPLTAAPHTPRVSTACKRSPRGRARSIARQPEDVRALAFAISSDESVHRVTFTARVHSPRPPKTRHVYHTGALPPVPPIPARFLSERRGSEDDDGLLRPRAKVTAGSQFGCAEFKAARRAKREGRLPVDGTAEPGELVGMFGFL